MAISPDRKQFAVWSVLVAAGLILQSSLPGIGAIFPGPTFWWIIIGLAVSVTGLFGGHRLSTIYGAVAAGTGLVFTLLIDLSLASNLLGQIVFGLVIGLGLVFLGFKTDWGIIPLGAYMLAGMILQFLTPFSMQHLMDVTWLMLGGAAFASFGYVKRSAFAHFVGIAFIFSILGVFIVGGNYAVVGLVGFLVVAGGVLSSFVYMHRSLGRRPHVEEVLTLAARALFLYGLRKPLDEYRLIVITLQGNIGTELIINELLERFEERWLPVILLGPTSPTQISYPPRAKVGWVTSLTGVEKENIRLLPPNNPTEVNIFLSETLKGLASGIVPVVIGDFLDSMIPFMKEDTFFKYYSDLASRIKLLDHTGVFILKSDIHPELAVNVVKRFADVIIENREREQGGRSLREVRVSNAVDNIQTDWRLMPKTSIGRR
jgi:hypothetical protein